MTPIPQEPQSRNASRMTQMPHPWVVEDRNAKGSLTAQSGHRHEPDNKPTNATRCRTFNKASDIVHGKGCLSHSIGITDYDLKANG